MLKDIHDISFTLNIAQQCCREAVCHPSVASKHVNLKPVQCANVTKKKGLHEETRRGDVRRSSHGTIMPVEDKNLCSLAMLGRRQGVESGWFGWSCWRGSFKILHFQKKFKESTKTCQFQTPTRRCEPTPIMRMFFHQPKIVQRKLMTLMKGLER